MSNLWNWKYENNKDFNTWIIIGTINSLYGNLSPEVRLQHTLTTIDSVHKHAPGSKILYFDNSSIPVSEEWKKILLDKVDLFHQLDHNLFSLVANLPAIAQKTPSEINMLHTAFNVLQQNPHLIGKRIFKQSGRYALLDTFNIAEYDDPKYMGKYTFVPKINWLSHDGWVTQRKVLFLEQALISLDPSLIQEFQAILPGMLHLSMQTNFCIEELVPQYIDQDKVILIDNAHVCGMKADSTPDNPVYGS